MGRCQYFALIDTDEANGVILNWEIVPLPEDQPGFLPTWLAEEGVSVVIARGMGSREQSLFQENRIRVVIAAIEDEPEKTVLDYMKGA